MRNLSNTSFTYTTDENNTEKQKVALICIRKSNKYFENNNRQQGYVDTIFEKQNKYK